MRIDNSRQLARAMHSMSLSARDLAKALRLGLRGPKTVARWLAGAEPLPGAVQVALEGMLRERHGPVVDMPEHDPNARNLLDQTPTRAHYASIVDNLDRPEVVRRHADEWWEKHRDLLNALLNDERRLSLEQYKALDRCAT